MAQPRNRSAPFVEGGFTQDRMVRPLVEAYHEAVGVYVTLATSCATLAVELFGFRVVAPMQPGGPPPIAAMRQDGQRDSDVPIEAHCTGQAIEVKAIAPDPQAVLYTVASRIADEQGPCTGVEVVRHHAGARGASSASHGQRPYRPLGPSAGHGFVPIADGLMAAFGAIQDSPAPGGCGQGMPAPEHGGAPTPHGHAPDAALIAPGECGIRGQLGVKGQPLRVAARDRGPERDQTEQLPRVGGPCEVGLGLAEETAVGLVSEKGEAPATRLATVGDVVGVQTRGGAAGGDGVKGAAASRGLWEKQRRERREPSRESAVLIFPLRPVGGVRGTGRCGEAIPSSTEAECLIEIAVTDLATARLGPQLEGEQPEQSTGGGDHLRAGIARRRHALSALELGQQRAKEENACDAGPSAASWEQ